MHVRTLDSNTARLKWRELLDSALAGDTDTIIERYGQPTAAVIPFADYIALQEELEDLRAARRAQAAYQEWKEDPATGEDWETVKAALQAEGLLA